MTPGARLSAAIELLEAMDDPQARPADKILADWARGNRYAGSKDRQAVATMVYGVLRRRAQLDWWLQRAGISGFDGRNRLLVWLQLVEGRSLTDLEALCTGERFAPAPLNQREKRTAIELTGQKIDNSCQPQSALGNFPAWLEPRLLALYGKDTAAEMAALSREAPVDLRVNTLKTDLKSAKAALAEEGIETEPTPYSPIGLRLRRRKPLSATRTFKDGWVEVQDEGSQLLALLSDARPGAKVVDFCAGAGGKSLAMAATMKNSGRIVACDVSEARLNRSAQRFKRAGAFMIERRTLTSERDKWIKRRAGRHGGGFDRVLVDAPCSGTGTWRRNPDQKWRTTETDIDELSVLQGSILDSASRLVSPGGRLIHATCSILEEENERQVERFLSDNPDYFLHPIKQIWADILPGDCPVDGDMLRLSPERHGTDGFFMAVLERKL